LAKPGQLKIGVYAGRKDWFSSSAIVKAPFDGSKPDYYELINVWTVSNYKSTFQWGIRIFRNYGKLEIVCIILYYLSV
jgi:hypothetical protein